LRRATSGQFRRSSIVDYRLGSTIAQSGVVSPIVLTTTKNYVSGTSVTSGVGGTTSTSITTGTVDTGLSIDALPRLISPHKIQLDLTILNNDLTALTSFTSGSNTVQLPTIDQRALHNDSVLRPGETLILSGYEQDTTTSSRNLGLIGSGKSPDHQKVRMIVIVRPAIIPLSGG
jgi:type II secretory pathway component GspD/PulD (secretin)